MVNSVFWLYLNDSLKRALTEFGGVAQHSLCMAVYGFLDLESLQVLLSYKWVECFNILAPFGHGCWPLTWSHWCVLENACGEGRVGFSALNPD